MNTREKTQILRTNLEELYAEKGRELLFHGWHHISFVASKALEFSHELQADVFITESAALTHDLNYIVDQKSTNPAIGTKLRSDILVECGYTAEEIEIIEEVVITASIEGRSKDISAEARAVSDGDSLFKVLPITPVLLSKKYLEESGKDIFELAELVCKYQQPLLDSGIYFYSETANQKYLSWAMFNLAFWQQIRDSREDLDVQNMLRILQER